MNRPRKAWVGLRQNGYVLLALDVDAAEHSVIQNVEVIHWILTYETLVVTGGYPLNVPPYAAQVPDDDVGVANWILRGFEYVQNYREMYFSNG